MSAREIATLLLVLGLLQALLALAARCLGWRLPLHVAAVGVGAPLVLLSPWILTSRLLVPSDDLAAAIPGASPLPAPDPHSLLSDVVYQLLPWELEVRHALADRRLPLWSDRLEGGSSPWRNPQAAVLSPIAFLARPLPIQHHLLAVHAIEMTIALEGIWLLAHALGAGGMAALAGGLGFALSGAIQAWALLPPSAAAAWTPWVSLAAIEMVRRPRPRRVAIGALLIAGLTLAGNPEVAAFGLAFAVVWALLLRRPQRDAASRRDAIATANGHQAAAAAPDHAAMVDAVRSDSHATGRVARSGRHRGLAGLALAVLLGSALAAPMLVPFVAHLDAAQRLDELAYSRVPLETLDWSPRTWFLPRDAPLLRAPLGAQVFGRPYSGLFQGTLNWAEASAGYAGLVALAGAVLALASRARRRAAPFLLTSIVGWLVAAGFAPLRAAIAALPGAGLVATGRLLPVLVLGLCVAGALGWSELARGRVARRAALALAPVAALSLAADPRVAAALLWIVLLALVLFWPRSRRGRESRAAVGSAALGESPRALEHRGVESAVASIRAPDQGSRRACAVALFAILLLDLGPWTLLHFPHGDTAAFYPVTPAIDTLRREVAAPGGPWRASGEDLAVYPSLLPVYGLDELRPHNPLAPRDYAHVLYDAFGFSPARRYFSPLANLGHPLLDFLNVRALVSYSTRPGAPGFRPVPPTLERIDAGEYGTFRLLRNRDALPRVFVPAAVDVLTGEQIDDWIDRLRDPRRVALDAAEVGEWRPAPRRFDAAAVTIEAWRPGKIALRVALPEGGLLATSIPGPAGWRARGPHGEALAVVRVDGAFLGVRVPAGVDRVTLGFTPRGFVLGTALGAAALAAVMLLLWLDRAALAPSRDRARSLRPRLAAIAAAALAVYFAASLARETIAALEPYWLRGPHSFRERNPARWRLASAPVERLRSFLAEVEPRLPPGSRVAFAGVELEGTEGAYRAMWAAYLLPRQHVLPAGQAWDADWYVAYGTRLDRADLDLVWESDRGALYRARPRSAAAGAAR